MAVSNDTACPTPRPRLLKGLVRHASAPAYPPTHLGAGERERRRSSSKQSLQSRRPNPLTELSLAQAVISRLRLERDSWRATAQAQEVQLVSTERDIERQERSITVLQGQNAALRAGHEEDVSNNNRLSARLEHLTAKHDKLASQLQDSMRAAARLKKSDRAKGKVVQRNLRLKATLQRYTLHASVEQDEGTEAALMEALAAASERVQELERKGQAVLDARNNVDSAKLSEAEVALREVLEDEMAEEMKERWGELLGE
jgi:hypothetical protein